MNVITAINLTAPMPSVVWMQKLRASLAAFAAPDSPLITGLLVENWDGPHAVHPIYSVGLKSIMNPNVLATLDQPICVRFITGGPDPAEKATGCWATPEGQGLPAKVVAAVRGLEATDVLASTALLNHLSIVTDQPGNPYEIRVLRIPGLCVEAFWLKYTGLEAQNAGSGDWIVPYGLVMGGSNNIKLPGGRTLNKNEAYTASDFLRIAADVAQKRLDADNNAPLNAV
jgi:hypothetical protein